MTERLELMQVAKEWGLIWSTEMQEMLLTDIYDMASIMGQQQKARRTKQAI